MIDMITPEKLKNPPEKLKNPRTDEADHLADAVHYWRAMIGATITMYNINLHAEQYSYACECKHCEITIYTSTKRLNCEYCGTSDPEVFTCTELK